MAPELQAFREAARQSNVNLFLSDGGQFTTAKNHFGARLLRAFRRNANYAQEIVQGSNAKAEFVRALRKSYGDEVAERAMRKTGNWEQGANFELRQNRALSSRRVNKVIQAATKTLVANAKANRKAARAFLKDTARTTAALTTAKAQLGLAANVAVPRIPTQVVLRAVASAENRARHTFSAQEVDALATKAIASHLRDRQDAFREMFPALAGLDQPGFKDDRNFFDATLKRLDQSDGDLFGERKGFREVAKVSLEKLREAHQLGQKASFSPERVSAYKNYTTFVRGQLDTCIGHLTAVGPDSIASPGAKALRTALLADMERQKGILDAKLAYYEDYLANQPFSEKQVALCKQSIAQGAMKVYEAVDHDLKGLLNNAGLDNEAQAIVGDAIGELLNRLAGSRIIQDTISAHVEQASATQTADPKSNPIQAAKSLYKTELKQMLASAMDEAKRSAQAKACDVPAALRDALVEAGQNLDRKIKQGQIDAMNTVQDWRVVKRDLVVSRAGRTRTYTSELTPAIKTDGRVARKLAEDGLTGISAPTKGKNAGHARNLQLTRLTQPGPNNTERLLYQKVRHGVIDPWSEANPQTRQTQAAQQADEVLHLAVESEPRFRDALLAERNNPNPPAFEQVHVSVLLTTPLNLPIMGKHHDYAKNHFAAFASHDSAPRADGKQYTVDVPAHGDNPAQQDVQTARVKVRTLNFCFPVNELGTAAKYGPLRALAWSHVAEQNTRALEGLVGDLQAGTAPGGETGKAVDQLRQFAQDATNAAASREKASRLIAGIQRQVDTVRNMWITDDFKSGNGDPYKMQRHVEAIVTLSREAMVLTGRDNRTLFSLSGGCMSNKDRAGMADVENKAMCIIGDMGGEMRPNEALEDEDQRIYDTVLTNSGQLENQQMNTGLPGSKNVSEAKERVGSKAALQYAKGWASFVKA